jgi:hypothetical protein
LKSTNPKIRSDIKEEVLADGTKAYTYKAAYISATQYEVVSYILDADRGDKRIRANVFTVEQYVPYDEALFSQIAHTVRFTSPPAPQATPAPPPATELSFKAKTYTNAEYGFSLQYPSDWVESPEMLTTPYHVAAFRISAYVPGVVLCAFDADAPESNDWIIKTFGLMKANSPMKVASPIKDETLADGSKAYIYKMNYVSQVQERGYKIAAYVLDAEKNGKRIRLYVFTVEEFVPYDEKLFSEIAHTLRFTAEE